MGENDLHSKVSECQEVGLPSGSAAVSKTRNKRDDSVYEYLDKSKGFDSTNKNGKRSYTL